MRISSAPAPRIGRVADDWAVQKGSYRRERVFREAHSAELIDRYGILIQQARAALIRPLAEQTAATREFLDGFAHELAALKQSTGALRFAEVTQALATALVGRRFGPTRSPFAWTARLSTCCWMSFRHVTRAMARAAAQWRRALPRRTRTTRDPSLRRRCQTGDLWLARGLAEIFDTLRARSGH